jgi:hypothetical protein
MTNTSDMPSCEQPGAPFRVWGHDQIMQVMLLSTQGLIIRNGEQRVLIPREQVQRFQCELALLVADAATYT